MEYMPLNVRLTSPYKLQISLSITGYDRVPQFLVQSLVFISPSSYRDSTLSPQINPKKVIDPQSKAESSIKKEDRNGSCDMSPLAWRSEWATFQTNDVGGGSCIIQPFTDAKKKKRKKGKKENFFFRER